MQRARLGADVAFKGFHTADGADGHPRGRGKPRLVPTQENARSPQLSSVDESH